MSIAVIVSMSLRAYQDRDGRVWTVWSIAPRFTPSRGTTERRQGERSRKPERRHGERRGAEPQPAWVKGWLCFESGEEKWRVAPVPAGWEKLSPEELDAWRMRGDSKRM